jgi:predicted Zn-dependent peptidase
VPKAKPRVKPGSSAKLGRTEASAELNSRARFTKRAPISSHAKFVRQEEITTVDLETKVYPNGLRVFSERLPSASSVAVGLWVNAGSLHESKSNAGIAHFIEHMVFKGTAGKSMREIMRSVESRGGMLNAYTTKEHTCYYTWTRTVQLREALDVLCELAARPNFTERDIERERNVIIEEINGLEDEPDELVFDLFEKELFGDHPLGRPVIGTTKSVSKFNREDLLRFHARHYRADQITIVASGAHQHAELFEAIEAVLGNFGSTKTRSSSPKPYSRHKPRLKQTISREGGQQSHIILGRRAPGMMSKDQVGISALVTLLGVGMSSRLNLRLREELGLAYDAAAFYSPFKDRGSIGLYVATSVESQERSIKEMRNILKGLFSRPISQTELDRTKDQMIGGLILSLESVSNRMMRAGMQALYYNAYHPLEKEIEKIAELELSEIRALAKHLFEDESGLSLVAVVPKQEDEE